MMRTIRARVRLLALACALVAATASPSFGYLKFGYEVNGRAFTLKWNTVSSPVG